MQHGIEAGDVMALRREIDVAVGIVEAELRRVQLPEEEMGDDVHGAEARAQMTRARTLDRDERVRAAHVRDQREVALRARELALWDQLHGCSCSTSSFTSTPQPGPAGIVNVPASISGTAVVNVSRHGTSSTSTSRMRTFGIAAHHCAEMNVARWL